MAGILLKRKGAAKGNMSELRYSQEAISGTVAFTPHKTPPPRDIANYVADNPSGHRAFIRHLFNHIIKQQIPAYGPKVLDDLQRNFAANGCNIQKLLIDIAVVATEVK